MINIAIFGLSANPPTGLCGHQGIVRHLVQSSKFDEIWILPVYRHILKEIAGSVSFEHRCEMCKLCFCGESTSTTLVRVLTLEQEVAATFPPDSRVGTIDILEYVRATDPNVKNISLVLGKDTFRDLATGKWKRYNEIPLYADFIVIERNEVTSEYENDPKFIEFQRLHSDRIVKAFLSMTIPVSSTALREQKPWSRFGYEDTDWIHPEVLHYIQKEVLYNS